MLYQAWPGSGPESLCTIILHVLRTAYEVKLVRPGGNISGKKGRVSILIPGSKPCPREKQLKAKSIKIMAQEFGAHYIHIVL